MRETKPIRIGNQTAYSAGTLMAPFEYAVSNGFDAFEWFPDKKETGAGWELGDLDAGARRMIRETALRNDIRLSVHAPWEVNPNQAYAKEALFEGLRFAREIGARILNIHLYENSGIASYADEIMPLAEEMADTEIGLSIENTPLTGPEQFNELFRVLAGKGSPAAFRVGMCLDIGHANLCRATLNDYIRFIDSLDREVPIIHVHMHENYGDHDSHLPLFSGPAAENPAGIKRLVERLKARNYSGSIILEQWTEPPSLLNEARDRLQEITYDSSLQGTGEDDEDVERIAAFPHPPVLGLFEKRIEGDDSLLRLAGLCFRKAGLGAEFNAATPAELERLLGFEPAPTVPAVVHLSREINLLNEKSRSTIIDFARGFEKRIFGMVVHDQVEALGRFDEYLTALQSTDAKLRGIKGGSCVFVEYAVGLDPDLFVHLFEEIADLDRITACIDIGHVGLWETRRAYALRHPGKDVCSLTPDDPDLPGLIEDVQYAVDSALDRVLAVVRGISILGKHVHFHMHDGHPLSTLSPFGISDHLSFLEEIPTPFEYMNKRAVEPMFGLSGLARIVTEALQLLGTQMVSFSLEIHPTGRRRSLGGAAVLFSHWQDKGNAEKMNHWLSVLVENQQLVLEACKKSLAGGSRL